MTRFRKDANIVRSELQSFCQTAMDLLFPPECSCCQSLIGEESSFRLCQTCLSEICVDTSADFCHRCGTLSLEKVLGLAKCPECRKRRFRFDRIIPLGLFRGRLRDVVVRTKNPDEAPLARSIGMLLADRVQAAHSCSSPELVVSIPKHWIKRILTSTNASALFAQEIANLLKIPFFPHALAWRRNIQKQSLLSVSERSRNVRGALKLSGGFDLRGAHVLIVDDTMTTGATVNEATGVLRRSGVSRVTVAVAARASNLETLDEVDLRSIGIANN